MTAVRRLAAILAADVIGYSRLGRGRGWDGVTPSFSTRGAPSPPLTETHVGPASPYPRRGALAVSRPAKGKFDRPKA